MKNYWYLALVLSLSIHSLLFIKYGISLNEILKKEETTNSRTTKIELTPETMKKITKNKPLNVQDIKPLPYLENFVDDLNKKNKPSLLKKLQISQKNIKDVFFSETSPSNHELEKNDAYMNYYRLIREKIKANAYHNYNSKREGEVLINFMVLASGLLQDIAFDQKSVASDVLKKIALKSVGESSPFPEFPEELKQYSYLRFNISIYFKND